MTPGDLVGTNRGLTQAVSRWAVEHGHHGIVYSSTHDASLDCWAIFDQARISQAAPPAPIEPNDPDLIAVVAMFELTMSVAGGGSL